MSLTVEFKIWNLFVNHLRNDRERESLRRTITRAHVAEIFKLGIETIATSTRARQKIVDVLLAHAHDCLRGDLQVQKIEGKGLGVVASRSFSTTANELGIVGYVEVLTESQWRAALAAQHISLIDDAGFRGILFGKLSLVNHQNGSGLRFKNLSASDPVRGHKEVRLTSNTPSKTLTLHKGDELGISYGSEFWNKFKTISK